MENRALIGVCIVTYNRLEKLKIALNMFDKQVQKPIYLIVIDNASADGTKEYLNEWKTQIHEYETYVISMSHNTGGSGGFYAGLVEALPKSADWIWLSDDDAYPEEDALEKASTFIEESNQSNLYSAICGEVINSGSIDITHRRTIYAKGLKIIDAFIPEVAYRQKSFPINSFSYVGVIINRNKLMLAGVTKKNYFIYNDDAEHSLRLSRVGEIVCVPSIKIHHNVVYEDNCSWKRFYGLRNCVDMYKNNFPRYCYNWFCLKKYIKSILRDLQGKDREINKMVRCAIRDGRKGIMGIHAVYRPGWKPFEAI